MTMIGVAAVAVVVVAVVVVVVVMMIAAVIKAVSRSVFGIYIIAANTTGNIPIAATTLTELNRRP